MFVGSSIHQDFPPYEVLWLYLNVTPLPPLLLTIKSHAEISSVHLDVENKLFVTVMHMYELQHLQSDLNQQPLLQIYLSQFPVCLYTVNYMRNTKFYKQYLKKYVNWKNRGIKTERNYQNVK